MNYKDNFNSHNSEQGCFFTFKKKIIISQKPVLLRKLEKIVNIITKF